MTVLFKQLEHVKLDGKMFPFGNGCFLLCEEHRITVRALNQPGKWKKRVGHRTGEKLRALLRRQS